MIIGTSDFFIKNEQEESSFFGDLELVLSKENFSKVAKDLKTEDGYVLKHKLSKAFMQLMSKYEIPYEIAESYTMRIMYAVLEQLRTISPQKYEHYFLQEWRDEQEKSFSELQNRIGKMSSELAIYNREQVAISSSGRWILILDEAHIVHLLVLSFSLSMTSTFKINLRILDMMD